MKVLWVSLVKFPPLCNYLGEKAPTHCGWMYSSAKALLDSMPELELGVIVYSYGKRFEEYKVDGITYYLVPSANMNRTNQRQVDSCKAAIEQFGPDIIHIHGTEHSLAKAVCMANVNQIKTLANIQGLAGPYTRYANGGLSLWVQWTNIAPLDFYRNTFIANAKRSFKRRARCENYVITHVTDIVGRTQWDHDHAITINPNLRYHFMNETLRDSFYESPIWNIDTCKHLSIFVSNSGAPLKGAHQVLKAMPIILRYFPDATVSFCGADVMTSNFKARLRLQGYHLYLRRLVKKLRLENSVKFLGALNEQQMKQAFLDAHIYVMPSAIENSPNSLCEAQILGVPTVASYCGGTPSLLTDGETGYFYRYEEIEMLAQTIIRLFNQDDLSTLSANERSVALARHDRVKNAQKLISIYNQIILA